jgi:hypothetical protein
MSQSISKISTKEMKVLRQMEQAEYQRFLHLMQVDNCPEIQSLFEKNPVAFNQCFWRGVQKGYLHEITEDRMTILEFLICLPQYEKTPLRLKEDDVALHETLLIQALNDNTLLSHMINTGKDLWQPLLKEMLKNNLYLTHIQNEQIVEKLHQNDYLTIDKTLVKKMEYSPVYLMYGIKNNLVTFSNEEYHQLYFNQWSVIPSILLQEIYDNHLDSYSQNLDLSSVLGLKNLLSFENNTSRSKLMYGNPTTFSFLLSHHALDESLMEYMIKFVYDNNRNLKVRENYTTLAHIVFSQYPEMSEEFLTTLDKLKTFGQTHVNEKKELIEIAQKIRQYEKIHLIVESNAYDNQSDGTRNKMKI